MRFSNNFIIKQSAFNDNLFLLFGAVWLASIVLTFGVIMVNFGALPNEIPLFYSHLWGAAQVAKKLYIYLPVVGISMLGIFNFGFAINFHPRDRVFAYLLGGTATLVAILTAITTINIVYLIT